MTYDPIEVLKPVAPERDTDIRFYGMPFPTRMTVVRLADGGLWVHSPTAFSEALLEEVSTLGPVRHLVAPNWIHYAYLADWGVACPEAETWAAPGAAERAASRGIKLRLDHEFDEECSPPWQGQIDWMVVAGSEVHRETVFFHRASRTPVLTDLIENFEKARVPWWMWPLLRMVGIADPDGKMPRDMAATFRKGKPELRACVERMNEWAPEQVIVAHGRWYERGGVQELRRAFRTVLG